MCVCVSVRHKVITMTVPSLEVCCDNGVDPVSAEFLWSEELPLCCFMAHVGVSEFRTFLRLSFHDVVICCCG